MLRPLQVPVGAVPAASALVTGRAMLRLEPPEPLGAAWTVAVRYRPCATSASAAAPCAASGAAATSKDTHC